MPGGSSLPEALQRDIDGLPLTEGDRAQGEAATGVGKSDPRLGTRTLLLYGVPILSFAYPLFFVQFFFLNFATDVLLLAPAAVGVLFGVGRIWDAITDPIAGYWSDRTRSRFGRRRPWMLAALPFLGLTFAMLWIPPASLSGNSLLLWTAFSLFGFYTAFTAYTIPHLSWGAELTQDHHERSKVFGLRHVAFTLGMMFAFGGMQLVTNSDDPRATAGDIAIVSVAVCVVLGLVPILFLRERSEFKDRGADNPWKAARDVIRNPHARILFAVWFIESLGGGVLGVLAPYMVKYILKRPDLIGIVPAVFVVAAVVTVPFWIRLSRRYGKRDVWRVAQVGMALSFGSTFFVQENQVAPMLVIMLIAGASTGCGGAVGGSMLADTIDYDEYKSGERKEGAYSAAWGFFLKVAMGTVIMLSGIVLQASGFAPGAEQGPRSELALRLLFSGLPFFAYLTAAIVFGRFKLDQAEHSRIRAELDRRSATTI